MSNVLQGHEIPWVVELWVIFVLFCVFLFPKFSKTHISLIKNNKNLTLSLGWGEKRHMGLLSKCGGPPGLPPARLPALHPDRGTGPPGCGQQGS